MSGWPELERRVHRILIQLLDDPAAEEAARMIADSAARLNDGKPLAQQDGGWSWPALAEPAADPEDMTEEERRIIAARFKANDGCPHCGGIHLRACPRVKRMAFRGDEIAEVEFWAHGQWPTGSILFPEDFNVDEG